MNNGTQASGGGIGFDGLLTIVFIVLKLTHTIAWSWWWVLSPLWIGAAIGVVALLIALVVAILASGTGRARRRSRY